MNRYGGGLSHRKHRSGPWGQVVRKHRQETARLLAKPEPRRSQRMYGSMRELMSRGPKGNR